MAARFVVLRSGARFHFVLKGGNHEIILTSEHYQSHAAALAGIASVRVNAPRDERYERKAARDGQPMFNLKAANGECIGTSETYSSVSAREVGIASVKANALIAPIDDRS